MQYDHIKNELDLKYLNEELYHELKTIGELTGDTSIAELRTLNHSKSKLGLNLKRGKEHLLNAVHKHHS